MTSRGTPDFWRLYRELPRDIQEAARVAYRRFLEKLAYPSRFAVLQTDVALS